jgi:xyloglucan 6-xylosyltransferase
MAGMRRCTTPRTGSIGTNAGSFVIRNCQWSLNLLDGWAKMGPHGPVGEKYGRIFAEALSNRAAYEADDQCESFFC